MWGDRTTTWYTQPNDFQKKLKNENESIAAKFYEKKKNFLTMKTR